MSAISDALEEEVAAIRALHHQRRRDRRARALVDRHFSRIMALIAPRIRHFTRRYGLTDMAEDAEQACAIGVHRAIADYEPERARFTTFVNWQLRGELQSLRFRVRLDSREGAKKLRARTVSLDTMIAHNDGHTDDAGPLEIVDASAMKRVETATATRLAHDALERMLSEYERTELDKARARLVQSSRAAGGKPGTLHPDALREMEWVLQRERAIVIRHVFADGGEPKFLPDPELSGEQQRQISRRVLRRLSSEAREPV